MSDSIFSPSTGDAADDQSPASAIAIVGMAGRFPGAPELDAFWHNLRDGVESIAFFTDDQVRPHLPNARLLTDPRYVKAGGALADVEAFDAPFFAFTPREAELTDPQHRLFLECCWAALEQAGRPPHAFDGAIGVYAGCSISTYMQQLLSTRRIRQSVDPFHVVLGNDKDFLATRVSYKLDLRGPSLTVQTACSTSLVAVHLACQALITGECDLALAGGACVRVPQTRGYLAQPGGMMSPDGHCRPFDARAAGTVGGSGVGVVVLKRLDEARADRDTILAVIRGSAVNNDGARKVGYTAPSVDRQAAVVQEALSVAGVAPSSVTYVEAHGTGTMLGDPVEVAALTRAFGGQTAAPWCGLGSLKSNIGHLDAAAGIASLIKVVLALRARTLPPSLHFDQPNPKIAFKGSPFFVVSRATPWIAEGSPRRAGVSALGVGGTNAHVIVEEAPSPATSGPVTSSPAMTGAGRPWHLLVCSGRSREACERNAANLRRAIETQPDIDLADAAYTLQIGRTAMRARRAIVCGDARDAVERLAPDTPRRRSSGLVEAGDRPVAFLFPGQGAQYAGMGAGLYETEPTFRDCVDRCARLLEPRLRFDLRTLFTTAAASAATTTDRLADARIAQPAIFIVEYALAELWREWGVRPAAMIGHSIGEYAAACLAGVFTLEDALSVVAERGRLVDGVPRGAMLAVNLPPEALEDWIGDDEGLSLAAVNAPRLVTVSGATDAIVSLEQRLAAARVGCRRLRTSHAFHSSMMRPIVGDLLEAVRRVPLHPPRDRFVSSVTGAWITPEEAVDAGYWASHLARPVRFADALATLGRDADYLLLEVGPGATLGTCARQTLAPSTSTGGVTTVTSLQDPDDPAREARGMVEALGRLWVSGAAVDWNGFHRHEARRRIPLPTYAFERERHWVDADPPAAEDGAAGSRELVKNPDPGEWVYAPYWKPSAAQAPLAMASSGALEARTRWLVLTDRSPAATVTIDRLRARGCIVTTVSPGEGFQQRDPFAFDVDPANPDFDRVLQALPRQALPEAVLHLWTLGPLASASPSPAAPASAPVAPADDHRAIDVERQAEAEAEDAALRVEMARGFYSLVLLAGALGRHGARRCATYVVSERVHHWPPEQDVDPRHATILAACHVLPQEYGGMRCRLIDVEDGAAVSADLLIGELLSEASEPIVVWRRGLRWTPAYQRLAAPAAPLGRLRERVWRPRGVYVITGGLGRIGLALARHLAAITAARLVLIGASAMPPADQWDEWIASHPADDRVSLRLRALREIEAAGGELLVLQADTCDARQLRQAIEQAETRFGSIHGVMHAAGVAGRKAYVPLARMGAGAAIRTACDRILRPKTLGVRVLDRVLGDRPLDFCLCFSSLSGELGGLGLGVYAAGNLDMDAVVVRRRGTRPRWMSVAWDGWDFRDEVTRDSLVAGPQTPLSMTPDEGLDVITRVLDTSGWPRLIVSTGDLDERVRQWVHLDAVRAAAADAPPPRAGDSASRESGAAVRHEADGAPADDVEARIAEIWQEVLGVPRVGRHDNFFELGGHSLLGLQLLARLRDRFEADLSIDILAEAPTVAALRARLAGPSPRRSPVLAPLVTLQPAGRKTPFFCVHPIGGGVLVYHALARHLGNDRPFYGVQAFALDQMGEEYDTVEGAASRYLEAVRATQARGPYLLGGFSFGGYIAFEMACQLARDGEEVGLLALMDAEPMTIDEESRRRNQRLLELHDPRLLDAYGQEVTLHLGRRRPTRWLEGGNLDDLPAERRLSAVFDALVRHGVLRADDGLDVLRRNLLGIRNRLHAMYAFRPSQFPGRVTLFTANRVNSPFEEFLATEVLADDAGSPWAPFSGRPGRTMVVPGEHNFLVAEPHVQLLARRLRACMDDVDATAARASGSPAGSASGSTGRRAVS